MPDLHVSPSSVIQVNLDGKRALLEQALRIANMAENKCFCKILFTSKVYRRAAIYYSVCRFTMSVRQKTTEFGFTSCKYGFFHHFSLSFYKARRIIRYLNPMLFTARINLKGRQTSEFLHLIRLVKGGISFVITEKSEAGSFLLWFYWLKLSELACIPSMFEDVLPVNKFEFLCTFNIETMNDLRKFMRHNSKKLELLISNDFVNEGNELIQNVGCIRHCMFHFSCDATEALVQQAVWTIVKSCPTLTKVSINEEFNGALSGDKDVNSIFELISKRYNFYKVLVKVFSSWGVKSEVNVHYKDLDNDVTFPVKWQAELSKRKDFELIEQKTTVVDEDVYTILSASQKARHFKAEFCMQLRYKYFEIQNVEVADEIIEGS